jgi:hypothetical protein
MACSSSLFISQRFNFYFAFCGGLMPGAGLAESGRFAEAALLPPA